MAYRGDDAGLRARVADLEARLASADQTIARLKGESASPDVKAFSPLVVERDVDVVLGAEGFAAIATLLRARMPSAGRVTAEGDRVRWFTTGVEMVVEQVDGVVRFRIDEDRARHRRTLLLLAVTYALTFTSLAMTMTRLPVLGGVLAAVIAVIAPLSFLMSKRRRQAYVGVLEAAMDIAREHDLATSAEGKARFAAAPDAEQRAAEEEMAATEMAEADLERAAR